MYTNNSRNNSRPVTPSEEDCCQNGCDPCIFDIHIKLVKEYERRKEQNIKSERKNNILHLASYRNFVVTSIRKASEHYIFLTIKYQEHKSKDYASLMINPGQYVTLNLQNATKPLTPISHTNDSIEFLVKLYSNGQFSTYLANIKVGENIRVRGPYGNFKYKWNSFQKIVMFSMGSGIAAVYPIAKSIVDNESEETKIHLIGGFKNVLDIPLKKELQVLTDYWNFKCTLCLSQSHDDTYNLHGINIKSGRLKKEYVAEVLKHDMPQSTLILICGTDLYNTSLEECIRYMGYTHIHIFK